MCWYININHIPDQHFGNRLQERQSWISSDGELCVGTSTSLPHRYSLPSSQPKVCLHLKLLLSFWNSEAKPVIGHASSISLSRPFHQKSHPSFKETNETESPPSCQQADPGWRKQPCGLWETTIWSVHLVYVTKMNFASNAKAMRLYVSFRGREAGRDTRKNAKGWVERRNILRPAGFIKHFFSSCYVNLDLWFLISARYGRKL